MLFSDKIYDKKMILSIYWAPLYWISICEWIFPGFSCTEVYENFSKSGLFFVSFGKETKGDLSGEGA